MITKRRMMIGTRESVDFICTACLVIVLEPEKGCPRCHDKKQKQAERLKAFLLNRKNGNPGSHADE